MRVLVLSVFLLLGAVSAPVLAQSGLDDKQKAVVVFDIRLDKIRNSDLAKALDLSDRMNEMKSPNSPNIAHLERVFGAISAPENMEAAAQLQVGKLPMEFFIRAKFSDHEEIEKLLVKFDEDNGGVIEKNGKKYYKMSPAAQLPPGIVIMGYAVDDLTFEFGTEAYIFRSSDNTKPFTDGLNEAWSMVPDDAIRIAIDLDGPKEFIAEAIALGKQSPNPMLPLYLGLIDNMKNLRVSLDVSGKNLLTIQATGISDAAAEELAVGISALLTTAKGIAQKPLAQAMEQDPVGGAVLKSMIDKLAATQEGTEVSIVIAKPEGFDAAIEKAVKASLPPVVGASPQAGGGGQ